MNRFEEGLRLIEESCGNGKNNVIALSTITLEVNEEGKPYPAVRDVGACYEEGVFYIVTSAKSNKVQQIMQNNEVAFVVPYKGIYGNGLAENLGWVLNPKNAELRMRLRDVFSSWYDEANNEEDEDCIILALHLTTCTIFREHGGILYNLDFINKTEG